jgi:hypothetical protein
MSSYWPCRPDFYLGKTMEPIYQQQAEHYAREGYALFENVLQAPLLDMLREQCDVCLAREDARMDELGVDAVGMTHRGKRYFVAQCQRVQPALRRLLFSPLMADVCHATLGFDAYFFLDQFVVKCADGGLPYSWHQDSGYVIGNGGPPDNPGTRHLRNNAIPVLCEGQHATYP